MADPLATVNADLAKAAAWYKSKVTWIAAGAALVVGILIGHFV